MTAEAPTPSRDQARSRRPYQHRSRTIRVRQMTKLSIEIGRQLFPETDHRRPQTRAECVDGPRPCPYVSCKYHLYLDVQPRTGAIKLNFPDIEVEEMKESCALDVADRGGVQLQELGALTNLTRERVRQLEVKACEAIEDSGLVDLRSLLPDVFVVLGWPTPWPEPASVP